MRAAVRAVGLRAHDSVMTDSVSRSDMAVTSPPEGRLGPAAAMSCVGEGGGEL